MKVNVLDKKGNIVEEITLNEAIFDIEPNVEVLNQYLRVYRANQRQGTSSTKTRGEVSGGGIKPWNQKGTGRARVGSSRNPLWRHGGISHGPKPKDWSLDLPKKVKKLAFLSAISAAFDKDKVVVVDSLEFKKPSTKDFAGILKNIRAVGKSLVVLGSNDENSIKSMRNVAGVSISQTANLNAYEVLNTKKLVVTKDALMSLEKKYEN